MKSRSEVMKGVCIEAGIIILYLLLSSLVLFPLFSNLNTYIVGGGELGGWLWRYWWMKKQLSGIFHIRGIWGVINAFPSMGLYPETGNILDLITLSIPLELLFGFPAYYNIKCLIIIFLNCLTCYYLLKYLIGERWLSFFGGLIFGINPYVMREINSSGLRQALMFLIPLYVLFLMRLMEHRRIKDGVFAGITFGLASIFYWFYGIFLLIFSVILILYNIIFNKVKIRGIILPLILASFISLTLMFPFALPYAKFLLEKQYLSEVTWNRDFPPYRLVLEVSKPNFRPVNPYQSFIASLYRVVYTSMSIDHAINIHHPFAIPIVLTLSAVLLSPFNMRKSGIFLITFFLFYLLTGGPYLQLGATQRVISYGDIEAIRLPFSVFFKYFPLYSRLFGPYRHSSIVYLSLASLFALNFKGLFKRISVRIVPPLIIVFFFFLYFLQMFYSKQIPCRWASTNIPEVYRMIKDDNKAIFGIVELPFNQVEDSLYYYQTFHEKRILGDWATPGSLHTYLIRGEIPELESFVKNEIFPSGFIEEIGSGMFDLNRFGEREIEVLKKAGYKYIIVHEKGYHYINYSTAGEFYDKINQKLKTLLGQPIYEGKEFSGMQNLGRMLFKKEETTHPQGFRIAAYRIESDNDEVE